MAGATIQGGGSGEGKNLTWKWEGSRKWGDYNPPPPAPPIVTVMIIQGAQSRSWLPTGSWRCIHYDWSTLHVFKPEESPMNYTTLMTLFLQLINKLILLIIGIIDWHHWDCGTYHLPSWYWGFYSSYLHPRQQHCCKQCQVDPRGKELSRMLLEKNTIYLLIFWV